jgi:hypothetical protein
VAGRLQETSTEGHPQIDKLFLSMSITALLMKNRTDKKTREQEKVESTTDTSDEWIKKIGS